MSIYDPSPQSAQRKRVGRTDAQLMREELVGDLEGPPDAAAFRDDDVNFINPKDGRVPKAPSGHKESPVRLMGDRYLRNYANPDDYKALKREIEMDPDAFGDTPAAITGTYGGKSMTYQPKARVAFGEAKNWVDNNRDKREKAIKEKELADARAVELEKARVPIEAARISAGTEEKRIAAEQARIEAENKRRDAETTYQHTREAVTDKDAARRREMELHQKEVDAQEALTAKQGRRAKALADLDSELSEIPWEKDEQVAAFNRLKGRTPDLADITPEQFEKDYRRRPSADQAVSHYAEQINKLSDFVESNYILMSSNDKRKLKEDTNALLEDARAELAPAQFEKFKRTLGAKLKGKVEDSWLWDWTGAGPSRDRRAALAEIFGD